jgi:hypothetical protein
VCGHENRIYAEFLRCFENLLACVTAERNLRFDMETQRSKRFGNPVVSGPTTFSICGMIASDVWDPSRGTRIFEYMTTSFDF